VFTVQRLSDLGLMPKILLASAVISRLGRVLPLAIMCHLTSTLDPGEFSSLGAVEGSSGLLCPASSGSVSLSMEGGLKREELERSVFRRLLLGVSGLIKELSWPPPNIMLGKAAEVEYLVARARRAPEAETFLLGLEFSLSPQSYSSALDPHTGRLSVVP